MSFYDDASLVFLPSGEAGKDGKAYSMKPTNGDGDFTFSRGSNLTSTRVDSNGLIEKGRENLLLKSNLFDNGGVSPTAWATSNASVSSGQSGYDGSSDAWLLQANSDGGGRRLQQSITQGGVSTLSIYAKAGTTDWIRIEFVGASSYVYFDLTNGVLGSETNAIGKIESIGNGWYRCSAVNISGSTPSTMRYILASANNNVNVVTGDNIYIQDAQLEIGLVATDYIESGATTGKAGILEDSPRFDYSGGASCPSLLLEPSRSNEIGYSEYFEGWTQQGSPTITSNYGTSPEGVQNSSRLKYTTEEDYIETSVTNTSGVFSIYAKGTGNLILTDSGANASSTTALTSSYQRIDLYFSTNTTTIQIKTDSSGLDAEVYGAQFENATYETSYIPNHSGGSVTREADILDRGSNLAYRGNYTLFMEFNLTKDAVYFLNSTTGSSYTMFLENDDTYFKFGRQSGDAANLYFINKFNWVANLGTNIKFALVKNGTDAAMFINGTKYTPSTNTLSTGNEILDWRYLNYSTTADRQEQTYIKQLLEFEEALSDVECITLTS